jgi:hypothetical protein
VPDRFPVWDPFTVKLLAEAEFMFWSKVAETTATALAELSLTKGETLTTPGGG